MVQCIINIILLYSPPIISSVVQPGPAERVTVCQWLVVCWQRQVQRCQAAQCAVPASVVDWGSTHHHHGAQADHPRPHSSGARPGGALQL